MSNLHTLYGTARARQSCCALLLLLCSTSSFALGLGELRNQHNLGERFSAQVELVAPPERGTPLMVRLASAEEYQRNDLIYPTDLRFKFVVQNNEAGQAALILISSTQAVQEPFVQLL
ncbi:MAG: type IV pilus assembly protein FimV, partial [Gallionella sp.]